MGKEKTDMIFSDSIISKIEDNYYQCYLDSEVTDPKDYREVFDLLKKTSEKDTISLIINTDGGDLFTAVQIYNYILNCKATVIAEIYRAYSAGALIAMACDDIDIKRYATMMFHGSAWSNIDGKVVAVKDHTQFINNLDDDMIENSYDNFLAQNEIDKLKAGIDLWFNEDEINERLKTWKSKK